MDQPSTVTVPMRIAAPSLTAAGLAGWVFAHAGAHELAARTRTIQDVIDAALTGGATDQVEVDRSVVVEAADLWEQAADGLSTGWTTDPAKPNDRDDQQAIARLRNRAASLRQLLDP